MAEGLLRDVRFALRNLGRSPGFAAAVAVTLALGIGANTAIFSLLEALLLRPLPFRQPDRLAMVWQTEPGNPTRPVAPANFLDWRAQSRSFQGLAAFDWRARNLTGGPEPVRLQAATVSANFFEVLGVTPALGRTFSAGEAREAVISDGLWRRLFASAPEVVGRRLLLDREPYEVVGVMPPAFAFPQDVEVWLRAPHDVPELGLPAAVDIRRLRDARYFRVIGRLAEGIRLPQAQAEMDAIARRLEESYPEANAHGGVNVMPLKQHLVGRTRPTLLLLQGVAALVLLIACANVANLLLARAARRRKEMAIRSALGASRGRLVAQLLTESVLLAVAGGAVGLWLAAWMGPLLAAVLPASFGAATAGGVSAAVLLFTLSLSLLVAIVFGLAPAWEVSRPAAVESLREGRTSASSPAAGRLRGALVAGEVGLALVVAAGAALLLKSLWLIEQTKPGFDARGVLSLRLSLAGGGANARQQYAEIVERLSGVMAVEEAALAQTLPASGRSFSANIRVEGRSDAPGQAPDVCWRVVTPDYFRALRIPLREGRLFTSFDGAGAPPVALVNETLATLLAGDGDVLGRRIGTGLDGEGAKVTVVGVVGDTPQESVALKTQPEMYRPLAQPSRWSGEVVSLIVRTKGDPVAAAPAVRAAIRSVSREATISEVRPLRDLVAVSVSRQRSTASLLGLFAALALGLCAVGVYGLLAYLVGERTREFGVRLALGARPADVLRLVLRRGLGLVAVGTAAGLAAALALGRVLSGLLYEISARDPATLAAACAVMAAVGLLASYLPARRATRVDPMVALRCE
ncbi:MAG TPA: ABC transporter permease [Vicinamibacteria bacterium]|nr:ABC transporter permease [Vicinamibacteria bacterium]